jgi:hypothetical protein
MTANVRALLAQIATFEAQNKAGLTPLPGELIEFFETARQARLDVRAFDNGMPLPGERPTLEQLASALERVNGDVVELTARVPIGVMARAVLDKLGVEPAGKPVAIGRGPCGA